MSDAGAAIAAMRMRKERQLFSFLRERGATSAPKAVSLDSQGRMGAAALRTLVRHRAVIEATAGAFYLDAAAYDTMRSRRRLQLGVVFVIAVFVLVVTYLATSAGR